MMSQELRGILMEGKTVLQIGIQGTRHLWQDYTVVRRALFFCISLLLLNATLACQVSPFSKVIVTPGGCRVNQISHEINLKAKLSEEYLCQLDSKRVYIKAVKYLNESGGYCLVLQSLDSLADATKNHLELICKANGAYVKRPDISPVLPIFFINYSSDYIARLDERLRSRYPYYGFNPVRDFVFKGKEMEVALEAFNGLGYRFTFELQGNDFICTKTVLENFGTFYDNVIAYERAFMVGEKMGDFSYEEFYVFFENTEDL